MFTSGHLRSVIWGTGILGPVVSPRVTYLCYNNETRLDRILKTKSLIQVTREMDVYGNIIGILLKQLDRMFYIRLHYFSVICQ